MRRSYKRLAGLGLHAGLLVLLIGVSAAVPATALGASRGFCASLSGRASTADQRLAAAQAQLTAGWQAQDSNFAIASRQQSADISNLHRSIQTFRSDNLLALSEHYDNPAQAKAIDRYHAAVRAATVRRDSAAKAGRREYAAALQRAVGDRRATLSGQAQALKIAVDDAFNQAEADCSAAVNPATVQTQLKARLATAHRTFVSQRSDDDAIVPLLQQLALRRNRAIAVADEAYEHSTAAALQTLRSGLAR